MPSEASWHGQFTDHLFDISSGRSYRGPGARLGSPSLPSLASLGSRVIYELTKKALHVCYVGIDVQVERSRW